MAYTLTISFTEASPTPPNGYRVTYWASTYPGTVYTVYPNPTASPVVINGLMEGYDYDGTIEASCSDGSYSSPETFNAIYTP